MGVYNPQLNDNLLSHTHTQAVAAATHAYTYFSISSMCKCVCRVCVAGHILSLEKNSGSSQ